MLLKIDFKTVNTDLSHTFNHKICFKYAVYIVGFVWFVFNGKIWLFIYCRRRPNLLKVPIIMQETYAGNLRVPYGTLGSES